MTQPHEQGPDPTDHLTQATAWFVRLRSEEAEVEDLTQFQRWLEESQR